MFSALSLISIFVTYALARPELRLEDIRPSVFRNSFVINGVDARRGEFPWQLSLEVLNGGEWFHNCGASLLSNRYGLSAAHCVDGYQVNKLRIKAGLYQLSDDSAAQIVYLTSYKKHERYQLDPGSISNDIAVIQFSTDVLYTENVKPAIIPSDNSVDFAGQICTISGWGRTSASFETSDKLQKSNLDVLSVARCKKEMEMVNGAEIVESQICVMDPKKSSGACNGDSGGPLNCQLGQDGLAVVGVASWVVTNFRKVCQPSYPSVYTRVSYYADWIQTNTK